MQSIQQPPGTRTPGAGRRRFWQFQLAGLFVFVTGLSVALAILATPDMKETLIGAALFTVSWILGNYVVWKLRRLLDKQHN